MAGHRCAMMVFRRGVGAVPIGRYAHASAFMSTQLAEFEKYANPSLISVAPTVIGRWLARGRAVAGAGELLPAAIAKVTPGCDARATA